MPRIICVEGNIGSGKSTALEAVRAARPDLVVVPEPVDEWGDLLDAFYANPSEWGFCFNLRVLASFARNRPTVDDAVYERSPSACRHVFGQILYNDGHMTPRAWDLFKGFADDLGWEPDAYIYVHTPVDTCFERIQQRGRDCEARGISKEYLARIEFQYENMVRFTLTPVVRVDGTLPPHEIAQRIVDQL
jgi:deoxyadenosine/deoxycytidine kinase